jgi:hypothetical protein
MEAVSISMELDICPFHPEHMMKLSDKEDGVSNTILIGVYNVLWETENFSSCRLF